jgi:hypothetical protein
LKILRADRSQFISKILTKTEHQTRLCGEMARRLSWQEEELGEC